MRNITSMFILLIGIVIILFAIFTSSSESKDYITIGEDKYLKFLWMVDGAFNDERFGGVITVNGKSIKEENKIFKCKYSKNNKNTCVGSNFEEEFQKLFASNIKYEDVYGDKLTYKWFEYKDGKYYFTNPINCNINERRLEYQLSLKKKDDSEIIYTVKFNNDDFNHEMVIEFSLIKENDLWKISNATYYDLCGMEYVVE